MALVCLLLLAFALRARDAPHVFRGGGTVILPGYDTWYHLRRIQKAVADYPHVPSYDAWANHPWGARIYWPVGFDLGLATIARLAGAAPWSPAVERVCAWAMPALGVGLVAAACGLGRLWRGWAVGLAAGAIVAVLPAAIHASAVGRVDHDAAAALLATLGFAAALRALRAAGRIGGALWAAAGGVLLGLGVWVWPPALLFLLVASGWLFARALTHALSPRPSSLRWGRPALVMLSACVTVAAICLGSPTAPSGLSFAFLSDLHLVIAVAVALPPTALWLIGFTPRHGRRGGVAWTAGVHVFAVALAFGLMPEVRGEVAEAARFLGREADVVVAQAGEARGLFDSGLAGAADVLTWAVVAFPFALALAIGKGCRPRRRRGDWLVVLWASATGALTLTQRRFAAFFAVPFALCTALLVVSLWRVAGRWRSGRGLRGALVVVAVAAVALPSGRWRPRTSSPTWEFQAVLPALRWLRMETDPAGNAHDFTARPAYGVLAFWHYGHWLTYVAERANIACPFGNTPRHRQGLDAAHHVLASRTEAAAAARCRRLKIRYVLSTDLPLPLIVAEAGEDPRRPYAAPILAAGLQRPDGPKSPQGRALRHFRLRAEFPTRAPWGLPLRTRVFEVINPPDPKESSALHKRK